jgi:hypothetical protein
MHVCVEGASLAIQVLGLPFFFSLHKFFTALEKENPEPSFKPGSELGGFIFFIDAGNFHSFCHNIYLVFHILRITMQQYPQLGQTVLQQFFCKSKLAKTHKSPKHPSSSKTLMLQKKHKIWTVLQIFRHTVSVYKEISM